MCYVYAIESVATDRVYVGQTREMDERLRAHNNGYVRSTEKDRPWVLIARERFETRSEARWCEHQLKKSRGKRKRWIEDHRL